MDGAKMSAGGEGAYWDQLEEKGIGLGWREEGKGGTYS